MIPTCEYCGKAFQSIELLKQHDIDSIKRGRCE